MVSILHFHSSDVFIGPRRFLEAAFVTSKPRAVISCLLWCLGPAPALAPARASEPTAERAGKAPWALGNRPGVWPRGRGRDAGEVGKPRVPAYVVRHRIEGGQGPMGASDK